MSVEEEKKKIEIVLKILPNQRKYEKNPSMFMTACCGIIIKEKASVLCFTNGQSKDLQKNILLFLSEKSKNSIIYEFEYICNRKSSDCYKKICFNIK